MSRRLNKKSVELRRSNDHLYGLNHDDGFHIDILDFGKVVVATGTTNVRLLGAIISREDKPSLGADRLSMALIS